MKATTKIKRAAVACNSCRESKLKCLNNCDLSSCQRCTSLNLKCTYTLKTSQLKKKKLMNQNFIKPINYNQSVLLPDKNLIIEVVTIFFENQYKGIFPLFHKPSFLTFLRSDLFNSNTFIDNPPKTSSLQPDPVVLLAILALCARLHPELPKIYGEFNESTAQSFQPVFTNVLNINSASNASNYFGWHARKLISENFDNPSLSRVQALCILSSHEWGEGNALRSHMYSGLAVRMAMVLGLDEEVESVVEETFLEKEVKRRAMWSSYMMDRCNASGRSSKSCINIKDIHIKLPCDEKSFIFGTMNKNQYYREELESSINNGLIKDISCCGHMIYLFESWRSISIWVGETGGKLERVAPWDELSPFYKLTKELDKFEKCLPNNLKFNEFNIQAHIADGSAADFAYFHGLFFLCRIFLNREYFYSSPTSFPTGWWKNLAIQIFDTLDKLNSITKSLKPMNLMVIAPFTGFQVFTTASTSLYIAAYPSKVLDQHFDYDVTKKYQKMADYCLETLKSWSKSWGLGKNWIETLQKLRETFGKISDYQDDDLRHKMHDYGNIGQQKTKESMQISNLITEEENNNNNNSNNNNNNGSLDFMNNLDLANIFPDWSDAMNL
ncbi:hypothetical protein KGF54_003790 [Candida jiufengensis]|uniref:uncharacterized protein n=1 Tax=Candida jiufengensis TaxID=497108 RepID=UPI0022256D0E|nr:uncharacterized protein KGF54_003790 [Candida jiufengensis]KAI5950716.1 hypothetical protein KGF54_003790 [Candida jiufengensis]